MKSPEYDAKRDAGPVMWLTVVPSGPWNIGKIMGLWFLFAVVVSASVACVVGTIVPPGGDTHAVFHHVAVITFLTYAMGAVPMSIWYDRNWSTTFKNAVDSLLCAVATGWIFSMMWPKL
jgi:Na+/citrate or Na+/malate symporter